MNRLREINSADQLDYGKLTDPVSGEGIVPVICVDSAILATEGLLALRMQGFANEEAVAVTLEIGRATFFSRERQKLWTKGEESGNLLLVRAAYTDCDADSLLLDVDAQGPSCHAGAETCFVDPDG
ncbi:MAG TPA: phosphoribosyl-AMP cyclohydrolase [Candidatus Saccharimonadales bacterium]|nr:phosphoribosyl-AMP cyclohydrolase [Candidatus Saccharimonadales bacterium]